MGRGVLDASFTEAQAEAESNRDSSFHSETPYLSTNPAHGHWSSWFWLNILTMRKNSHYEIIYSKQAAMDGAYDKGFVTVRLQFPFLDD